VKTGQYREKRAKRAAAVTEKMERKEKGARHLETAAAIGAARKKNLVLGVP